MASLLSIIPPSTDCSAARSCGGCFSNGPDIVPRSSVSATASTPPRSSRTYVRMIAVDGDIGRVDTDSDRQARCPKVGPFGWSSKRWCGQTWGQAGDNFTDSDHRPASTCVQPGDNSSHAGRRRRLESHRHLWKKSHRRVVSNGASACRASRTRLGRRLPSTSVGCAVRVTPCGRSGSPNGRTMRGTSSARGGDHVGDGDRAEQLAGLAGGLRGQPHRAEALDRRLDLLGVVEVADPPALLGPADRGDLLLRAPGGHDGHPARQQEVAAVAVLDLDDVTRTAKAAHVSGEDELHDLLLSGRWRCRAAARPHERSSPRWRYRAGAGCSCRSPDGPGSCRGRRCTCAAGRCPCSRSGPRSCPCRRRRPSSWACEWVALPQSGLLYRERNGRQNGGSSAKPPPPPPLAGGAEPHGSSAGAPPDCRPPNPPS